MAKINFLIEYMINYSLKSDYRTKILFSKLSNSYASILDIIEAYN